MSKVNLGKKSKPKHKGTFEKLPEPEPEKTSGETAKDFEASSTGPVIKQSPIERGMDLIKRGCIYTGDDLEIQRFQCVWRLENKIPYGRLVHAIEKRWPGATKDWKEIRPIPDKLRGVWVVKGHRK
jgi:hypothetical protein